MPKRTRRPASRAAAPEPLPQPRTALAGGAVMVVVAFALYLATAARDITFGDTPELTTAALAFGVPHPPGYPLFVAIGWIFGQLPVGPQPFRIALLSVVCHALTVGVVYATTYRSARSIAAAIGAAAVLATEPLFWQWSLVGEVFPLNDLLSTTLILLVAIWHDRPNTSWPLIAAGLVGGIGMTDHQSIGLLAPAVAYVLWRRRDVLRQDARPLVFSVIAFTLGLSFYLALLVAASSRPAWSWGDLRGLDDLVAHVLRRRYGTTALVNEPGFVGGSALARIAAVFTSLDPLQWLLLAVGTFYAWRVRRWFAIYLLIAFAVSGPAFAAYSNVNVSSGASAPLLLSVLQRFFLLPHTIVAPLAGFAVLAARDLLPAMPRLRSEVAAAALATLAALAIVPISYRAIDRSDDHVARSYAMDILNTLKPNAVFLAGADAVAFPVLYLQSIEGVRPDVTTIFIPLMPESWYIQELRRSHPDLNLAADRYGAGGATTRTFLDANRGRTIAGVGDLLDQTWRPSYWLYSRGITFEIRPSQQQMPPIAEMERENESLLTSYHPARYEDVRDVAHSWERFSLIDYAQAYYRVGVQFEALAASVKTIQPEESKRWNDTARRYYERALVIYPDLPDARAGLDRLART